MTQQDPIDGRVWLFGDDISTDLIWPQFMLAMPREERPAHVFSANRPGWAGQVEPGDVIVAGSNFGVGSARPAVEAVRDLGIACLLAESINSLFFRNCVNYGLPALEIPGVSDAFEEGDVVRVVFTEALVLNKRTGAEMRGAPWPDRLLEILMAGGLLELMNSRGMLADADVIFAGDS